MLHKVKRMKYICMDCRESKQIKKGRILFAKTYKRKEALEHARYTNHNMVSIDETGAIKLVVRGGLHWGSQISKVENIKESYILKQYQEEQ